MNLIFGKSARGSTRIVIGDCYYFTIGSSVTEFTEPMISKPLPASLAWTEMNTPWKRGKNR